MLCINLLQDEAVVDLPRPLKLSTYIEKASRLTMDAVEGI